MSLVAYPSARHAPGPLRTAWLLVAGWLIAAAALFVLYLTAMLLGLIGTSSGPSTQGVLNEWPYPENGAWGLLANASVIALALLVATRAVASQLRESFDAVSEGRLAVVLLLTGGIPFVVPPRGAFPIGFVIAVWLVRRWVTRRDDRIPRRGAIVAAAAFLVTAGSYGFLHPVWVESAFAVVENPAAHARAIDVELHNVSRFPLTVERLDAGPIPARAFAGSPGEHRPVAGARIAPGATAAFTLELPRGGCVTLLPEARVRYRLVGLTLTAPLQVAPSGMPRCG